MGALASIEGKEERLILVAQWLMLVAQLPSTCSTLRKERRPLESMGTLASIEANLEWLMLDAQQLMLVTQSPIHLQRLARVKKTIGINGSACII